MHIDKTRMIVSFDDCLIIPSTDRDLMREVVEELSTATAFRGTNPRCFERMETL